MIIDLVKKMYLDYLNNFLTVESFSEYYGISEDFAVELIIESKRILEQEKKLEDKKREIIPDLDRLRCFVYDCIESYEEKDVEPKSYIINDIEMKSLIRVLKSFEKGE